MTLAHPWSLAWLLLAAPIIALYLRRQTPARRMVSTLRFWRPALATEPRRAGWLPRRRIASLGLLLGVLVLLVVALAEPVRPLAVEPPAPPATYTAAESGVLAAQLATAADPPPAYDSRLWPWLVAAAAGLLVIEWRLYHRRWTE